jgi:hypothetical protein
MNEFLKENMGAVEVVIRFLSGALLLAVIMINSIVPVWFALLAIYPVVTAIMAWDPVYAAVRLLRLNVAGNPHDMKAIPVS